MAPTPADFHALARSSPWRWSTLRYVMHHRTLGAFDRSRRVSVRRPDRVRVEDLDGRLRAVQRYSRTAPATPRHPAALERPDIGPDDLVAARLDGVPMHDDPMAEAYYDVSVMDPVVLADGRDGRPATNVDRVDVVEHRGRPAWEAIVRATADFEPRCDCCALLLTEASRDWMQRDAGSARFEMPRAHRVRLDVATAVCVGVEQLGGDRAGWGHELLIEAVDEEMGEELFPRHPCLP